MKNMWKEYSIGFIKGNRASSISVLAAAFISALFLSLLCGLFYNFWNYEIEAVVLEEGDWQGRVSGTFGEDAVSEIENFANVKTAAVNGELSDGQTLVIDVWFDSMGTVYRDMPLIARELGVPEASVSYHESLLSNYFIHDPQDASPPLLMTFYLFVLLLVSVSLILIIHNSFAVSMNVRVHQFGIFSSVGAAPGQIRACLLQEAAMLCVIPVLLGSFLGIALTFGAIQAVNALADGMAGRHEAVFTYHPLVLAATLLSSLLTVLISAWLPARKLSRLTPLEAIKNTGELQLKRKKKSRILALLFGIEGELAGNALKAQRKALRTAALSLTLSFLGFTLMLSFFTLSGISTNHTYFERYQDAWDVMAVLADTKLTDFSYTEEIHALADTDSVIYQKADALCSVPADAVSEEVKSLGGLEAIAGSGVGAADGGYTVQAPIVILDDRSFALYCEQIGVSSAENGSVVLNRIWDSQNSNFRYREYVPFLSENQDTMTLRNQEDAAAAVELPVRDFIQEIHDGTVRQRSQITKGVPVFSARKPVENLQNRHKPQLIGINLHVFFRLKEQKIILRQQIRHPGNRLLIGFRIGVAHAHPEYAGRDHKEHRSGRQRSDRYPLQNFSPVQKSQHSKNQKNKQQMKQHKLRPISRAFPIKI